MEEWKGYLLCVVCLPTRYEYERTLMCLHGVVAVVVVMVVVVVEILSKSIQYALYFSSFFSPAV